MSRENKFLDQMISVAILGGKMSLKIMDNSKPTLKPDQSVLTKADTAISKMVRKSLGGYLKTKEHILIDEEDKQSGRYFDQAALDKIPYIWVIDPIDGTRSFANRMPFYGVSLGLLKDCKPYLGVVYFPALDELFYSNGKQAYFVKAATSSKPKKILIKPVDQKISAQSVFFGSDGFFKTFDWDFSLCQMMTPSCAVLDLCFPALGRGAGAFFNAHIWDFAGAWPIFQSAGLHLYNLKTGETIDRLDTSLFQGKGDKTWRLRDYYILSSKRNFPIIRAAIFNRGA
jgi:myo-inositol-1(or 4)-monophosphatase